MLTTPVTAVNCEVVPESENAPDAIERLCPGATDSVALLIASALTDAPSASDWLVTRRTLSRLALPGGIVEMNSLARLRGRSPLSSGVPRVPSGPASYVTKDAPSAMA